MGYQPKYDSYLETARRLAQAMQECGRTTNDVIDSLAELTKYVNSQLGPETPADTENPNQKSDLEIFSQIEISPEFANLIDNTLTFPIDLIKNI